MPGEKISKSDFALRAIRKCRKPPFKGIHTVYSGFNSLWYAYYGDDPAVGVNQLIAEGVISGHGCKGGFTIGLLEDSPSRTAQVTLDKLLED